MSGSEVRTALVTGGGTGIGAAIAEALVAAGYRVCLSGRRQAALDEVLRRLPSGSAVACAGDVGDEGDVRRMVDAAARLGEGRLDVVVNNAAAPVNGTVETVALEDWRRALDVNLTGPMLVTRTALPALRAAGGGAIVNVASVAALAGNPGITPYATSKAALVALTRQCAIDFGGDGIRVNAVCPGTIDTPWVQRLVTDAGESLDALRARQPMGRLGTPEEVAEAVLYLTTAEFATGTILTIDGGLTAA
jgi:NAD(P)-dependent dehydrogenase (short-subunit alcohol dehydrogenase family)